MGDSAREDAADPRFVIAALLRRSGEGGVAYFSSHRSSFAIIAADAAVFCHAAAEPAAAGRALLLGTTGERCMVSARHSSGRAAMATKLRGENTLSRGDTPGATSL